jgi:hypothetical protein
MYILGDFSTFASGHPARTTVWVYCQQLLRCSFITLRKIYDVVKIDPGSRVARFFLLQYTKKGDVPKLQLTIKYSPKGCKIFQMARKYSNIFYIKALQNIPIL